jgi:hypothetical protein
VMDIYQDWSPYAMDIYRDWSPYAMAL